jgi:hypothetical protein
MPVVVIGNHPGLTEKKKGLPAEAKYRWNSVLRQKARSARCQRRHTTSEDNHNSTIHTALRDIRNILG